MKVISLLGVDLAKNTFQLHGTCAEGKRVFNKALSRARFFHEVVKLRPSVIAFEACGSAHYWGRRFSEAGIEVRLIPAQFIKPFVRTNKSDAADAAAIALAAWQEDIPTVPVKGHWHMDMQMLHRERERLISNRTALLNQLRSYFYERGKVCSQGKKPLLSLAEGVLSDDEVTGEFRLCVTRLLGEYRRNDEQLKEVELRVKAHSQSNPDCARLEQIPGLGPITATAIAAAVPDKKHFKNGRHFSAWLGLTPRHTGSGGKTRMLGISRRGNPALRRLLILGAGANLRCASKRGDRVSKWAVELKQSRGVNKAKVALANKTARIAYVVLCRNEDYRAA